MRITTENVENCKKLYEAAEATGADPDSVFAARIAEEFSPELAAEYVRIAEQDRENDKKRESEVTARMQDATKRCDEYERDGEGCEISELESERRDERNNADGDAPQVPDESSSSSSDGD